MSTITIAIDAFVDLAERIINLEKTKRDDKEQVFKEIIEPLFLQLQPVAEDYLEIFRKAHELVDDSSGNELVSAINEIRNAREKMQLTRATIQTMADQMLILYKDTDIKIFAEEILSFFDTSSHKGTHSMQLMQRLYKSTRNMEDESDVEGLINYIAGKRGHLNSTWNSISKFYAYLKISYMSSSNLLNNKKK